MQIAERPKRILIYVQKVFHSTNTTCLRYFIFFHLLIESFSAFQLQDNELYLQPNLLASIQWIWPTFKERIGTRTLYLQLALNINFNLKISNRHGLYVYFLTDAKVRNRCYFNIYEIC